jgi:hypothetical protein
MRVLRRLLTWRVLGGGDTAAEKVCVLLYLCSTDDLQHPVRFEEGNMYYVSSWSEDMHKALQFLVRFVRHTPTAETTNTLLTCACQRGRG